MFSSRVRSDLKRSKNWPKISLHRTALIFIIKGKSHCEVLVIQNRDNTDCTIQVFRYFSQLFLSTFQISSKRFFSLKMSSSQNDPFLPIIPDLKVNTVQHFTRCKCQRLQQIGEFRRTVRASSWRASSCGLSSRTSGCSGGS